MLFFNQFSLVTPAAPWFCLCSLMHLYNPLLSADLSTTTNQPMWNSRSAVSWVRTANFPLSAMMKFPVEISSEFLPRRELAYRRDWNFWYSLVLSAYVMRFKKNHSLHDSDQVWLDKQMAFLIVIPCDQVSLGSWMMTMRMCAAARRGIGAMQRDQVNRTHARKFDRPNSQLSFAKLILSQRKRTQKFTANDNQWNLLLWKERVAIIKTRLKSNFCQWNGPRALFSSTRTQIALFCQRHWQSKQNFLKKLQCLSPELIRALLDSYPETDTILLIDLSLDVILITHLFSWNDSHNLVLSLIIRTHRINIESKEHKIFILYLNLNYYLFWN